MHLFLSKGHPLAHRAGVLEEHSDTTIQASIWTHGTSSQVLQTGNTEFKTSPGAGCSGHAGEQEAEPSLALLQWTFHSARNGRVGYQVQQLRFPFVLCSDVHQQKSKIHLLLESVHRLLQILYLLRFLSPRSLYLHVSLQDGQERLKKHSRQNTLLNGNQLGNFFLILNNNWSDRPTAAWKYSSLANQSMKVGQLESKGR